MLEDIINKLSELHQQYDATVEAEYAELQNNATKIITEIHSELNIHMPEDVTTRLNTMSYGSGWELQYNFPRTYSHPVVIRYIDGEYVLDIYCTNDSKVKYGNEDNKRLLDKLKLANDLLDCFLNRSEDVKKQFSILNNLSTKTDTSRNKSIITDFLLHSVKSIEF